MAHLTRTLAVAAALGGFGLLRPAPSLLAQLPASVASPDGRNIVTVALDSGVLRYTVTRRGANVLLPSALGFEFRGAPRLFGGLRAIGARRASHDETWTQPWGEVRRVRDHHNELRVTVEETAAPGRRYVAVFRVFNDGVGFRYELPEQSALRQFEIMEELTEFSMASDGRAWWIPSFQWNRYEYLFRASPLSTIDTVHTPLTLEMPTGLHVVIHEADLFDYAGLNIRGGKEQNRTLRVMLAPMRDSVKVRGATPFVTPWRTIQLADRAADLVPSVIGLNLNPPSKIADPSWVTPMTYNGIWWGMHINTMTWQSGPLHGATTANAKRYIDFAAANKVGGFLVEGWNLGWDGNWIENGDKFSFTQPYPDFDLQDVAAYAKSKGVRMIGHHETGMGIANYERQMDSAFALYRRLGITAVKTGYVGDKTKEGDAHHSQPMVRHFRKVIETAAKYGIAINAHEPIHDTGERRTWPNMISREGARGQEYNAWGGDGGNAPEHETILFFTRMLAGPMDFTPGIFDINITRPTGKPRPLEASRPRTTLAKQLALFVVLYSPIQMAADLPENYEGQPAFQFIRDVAVDWDTTRVLEGRIGDYVVVARKAAAKDEWFIGAITDEEVRTFTAPLSFLTPGKRYVAEIYADGKDAHFLTNPTSVAISKVDVTSASRLTIRLAKGGGQAIRIRPAAGR
ncbi:MAG: glycoside hydrolase family 97 protein [Gemmatimonadetes bacterium]|nr:glycoside hydrolase family 97 protein [Gemmatimonadota bacterium]